MTAVRIVGRADREAIVAMLARAFADDPAIAYILPDPVDRARRLPRLFGLMFDGNATGMRLATVGVEAATLWRGPGWRRTGVFALLGHLIPLLGALGPALGRSLAVGAALDEHRPSGDHWYLHIAGCDPAHQGRGLGRAAIRSGLDRVAARLPCYLETANEANLGFYAGLGFVVTAEWRIPKGGPVFWSMLRPAD